MCVCVLRSAIKFEIKFSLILLFNEKCSSYFFCALVFNSDEFLHRVLTSNII